LPSDLDLHLVDPNNQEISGLSCAVIGSETLCKVSAEIAVSGLWQLKIKALAAIMPLTIRVSGLMQEGQIPLTASVASLSGEAISYPEPITLAASVVSDSPLTGVNLLATIEAPDGSIETFSMKDDGVAPDAYAGDGVYSAVLDYEMSGSYSITVKFDNESGTAQKTYVGYAPSLGPDGEYIPLPDPVAYSENFLRMSRIEIQTANVKDDDHGNYPSKATGLSLDNTGIPGKIDYDADVDVFRIQSENSGTYLLRVSNLALGMNPHVRLLAEDGQAVLKEINLSDFQDDEQYMFLRLDMKENEVVFAEVTHQDPTGRGTYLISSGSQLPIENITTGNSSGGTVTPRNNFGGFFIIIFAAAAIFILYNVTKKRRKPTLKGKPTLAHLDISSGRYPGVTMPIKKTRVLIGRGSYCDLRLNDPGVSRTHALLQFSQGVWYIIDQQSKLGVYVNGVRIQSSILRPGDQILVGHTRIGFRMR
jgi:hypothetical protein